MNTVEPIKDLKTLKKIEKYLEQTSLRDLLLFVLGINTGLRISDILALNISDVKNKDFINIVEQKTGKHKKFPLNQKIKNLINIFIMNKDNSEPLFRTIYNNRLDRTQAYRIIKNACSQVGIKNYIGTHTLRKTFGYHHYNRFKDLALLQKIMNHSSPSVTLRYIGVEQEEINNSYLNFVL